MGNEESLPTRQIVTRNRGWQGDERAELSRSYQKAVKNRSLKKLERKIELSNKKEKRLQVCMQNEIDILKSEIVKLHSSSRELKSERLNLQRDLRNVSFVSNCILFESNF